MKIRLITILYLTLIFSLNSYSTNLFKPYDTLNKKWITTKYLPKSTSDSLANIILETDSIFKRHWVNDVLFVYSESKFSDLPDKIKINLLKNDERFLFNWNGLLYSGYGMRWGRVHRGLDLYLKTGDTVVSSFDGIVRYARFNEGGYGNCIIVRHLNGLETLHGHLSKICVSENQFVKAGNLIGLGGSTGRSDGPHLHFETRFLDFSFDPYLLIDKNTRNLISDTLVINKDIITSYKYPSDAPKIYKKYNNKKRNKYSKRSKKNRYKSKSSSQSKKHKGSVSKSKKINKKTINKSKITNKSSKSKTNSKSKANSKTKIK